MPVLARIINNKNQWKTPSGQQGKSKTRRTHEHDYGFGFDEWFLNEALSIEGQQYGFLRPFAAKYLTGKTHKDVFLYMQDNRKQRLIGVIYALDRLHLKEAERVRNHLASIKWDQRATEDLSKCLQGKKLHGAIEQFNQIFDHSPLDLVNVAFRLADLRLSKVERYLDPSIVTQQRYTLLHKPFNDFPNLMPYLSELIEVNT
jgi:hypothetical protein